MRPPNNTRRFAHYGGLFFRDQDTLQSNHEAYKKSDQMYPELTDAEGVSRDRVIRYKLISDLGRPYYLNNSLDFGI